MDLELSGLPRATLVVGLVPFLLVGIACGDGKGEPTSSASTTESRVRSLPCDGLLLPADPAAALPAGVPGLDGATFMTLEKQGATRRYFARAAGDDLAATRDTIKAAFEAAGYTIDGSDQEADAEAEFEFSGKAAGSVQVIHLCKGTLRIRWRLGPS